MFELGGGCSLVISLMRWWYPWNLVAMTKKKILCYTGCVVMVKSQRESKVLKANTGPTYTTQTKTNFYN